ncbi:hypothetical protein ONS95_010861 [Cadophora gregata]|uniref:uncharacterized protein n=1 Tax=Cadophora gregata TaxID=51156 RepID=UPI0026DC4D2F|nr:uncharacterized protein ONS95_010861 [Cadophora gregata]KAK0119409.1 hypothetical protein ONS95_010861 [Cadophora gregata]
METIGTHCDGPITPSATLPSTSVTAAPAITAMPQHLLQWRITIMIMTMNMTMNMTMTMRTSMTTTHLGQAHWHHPQLNQLAVNLMAALTTGSANATASGSVTLAPSPTESVGCEPHGDHWHCDGPAVTSSPLASASANVTAPVTTAEPSSTFVPSSAGVLQSTKLGVVGGLLAFTLASFAL